ncbi:hypothetical protein Tco_0485216 [Tanacetum coccineum]
MYPILRSFDNIDEQTELQCSYLKILQDVNVTGTGAHCLRLGPCGRVWLASNDAWGQGVPTDLHLFVRFQKPQILGVIHRTSVSRPQLKSTQMKDKVVQNSSKVKIKQNEVEDHHRISSFSNKTKSVTAGNDKSPELRMLTLFV